MEMTIRDEQTGAGILTCPSSHTYLFQFTFIYLNLINLMNNCTYSVVFLLVRPKNDFRKF